MAKWNISFTVDHVRDEHHHRILEHLLFRDVLNTTGRLGTYSIRLLVEHYLGGRVGFESDSDRGANFHVRLPMGGLEVTPEDRRS